MKLKFEIEALKALGRERMTTVLREFMRSEPLKLPTVLSMLGNEDVMECLSFAYSVGAMDMKMTLLSGFLELVGEPCETTV